MKKPIKELWIMLSGQILAFDSAGDIHYEALNLLNDEQRAKRENLFAAIKKAENIYLVDKGNFHQRIHHDQALNMIFWNDPLLINDKLQFSFIPLDR